MPKKKVAKKLAIDTKPLKTLLGRKVLFIGAGKGVVNTCPNCGKRQNRGMISEYKDKRYCSEGCVRKVANV